MNRNVLCTSNPIESELHRQAYEYAKKISEHLLLRTRGYLDMWVDGKKFKVPTTSFKKASRFWAKPICRENSKPQSSSRP